MDGVEMMEEVYVYSRFSFHKASGTMNSDFDRGRVSNH
jgi:hypothetical protein